MRPCFLLSLHLFAPFAKMFFENESTNMGTILVAEPIQPYKICSVLGGCHITCFYLSENGDVAEVA